MPDNGKIYHMSMKIDYKRAQLHLLSRTLLTVFIA